MKAIFLGVSLAISLMAVACGSPISRKPPVLTEAYQLMDQGQNARVILLLEDQLARPRGSDSEETRILLASAYLGKAGLDVFAIYQHFKDFLFARPLKDSFLDSPSFAPSALFQGPVSAPAPAPLKDALATADRNFVRLKQAVSFLHRFPHVPRDLWPLLERALEILDAIEGQRDLKLYRVFVRVVYLKAYLDEEVIKDPDFGTREWACAIEFRQLMGNVDWSLQHLTKALDDYEQAVPRKAGRLQNIYALVKGVFEELNETDPSSPTRPTFQVIQDQLREWAKCAD